MPQPALNLKTYLGNVLPELRGELPAGTGGKTPRPTWPEGKLTSIVQIDEFKDKVAAFVENLPGVGIPSHPACPFPHLVSAARSLNLSSESSLLASIKLPLDATHSVLSSLDLFEHSNLEGESRIQSAVEEDGQAEERVEGLEDRVGIKFGKSPMGETEFIFVDHQKKPVLVVRALTTTFHDEDWQEFSVTGPYHYNPKSRASWLWSRQAGGTTRLEIKHFVLTDYDNWVFGVISEDRTYANISPVISAKNKDPTVLQSLAFWVRSALGHQTGFAVEEADTTVQGANGLFPDNPARRATVGKEGERPRPDKRLQAKLASESDVEDSDVAE